jgi:phosphoribosyl 1,2-cyclic phosphodiesterase
LSRFKVAPPDLDAVFLTHEHGDHIRCACGLSRTFGIPLIANAATLEALPDRHVIRRYTTMDTGSSLALGDLIIESFPVSHDAVDPVGYNIYCSGYKVSYVTDTGIADSEILRKIEGAHLAIVEANYDHERLIAGPYPQFLKNRILGDRGHLSNEAAADLILSHASKVESPTFWLAHLSRSNNSPRTARRHVQRRLSEHQCTNAVLDVALRDIASLTWRPRGANGVME